MPETPVTPGEAAAEAVFADSYDYYLNELRKLNADRRKFDPRMAEHNPNVKSQLDLDLDFCNVVMGLYWGLGYPGDDVEKADQLLVDQREKSRQYITQAEVDIETDAMRDRLSELRTGPKSWSTKGEIKRLAKQLEGRNLDYISDPAQTKRGNESFIILLDEVLEAYRNPIETRARQYWLQAQKAGEIAIAGATAGTGSLSDMLASQPVQPEIPQEYLDRAQNDWDEIYGQREAGESYRQQFIETIRGDAREAAEVLRQREGGSEWALAEGKNIHTEYTTATDINESRDVTIHHMGQPILLEDGTLVIEQTVGEHGGSPKRRQVMDAELYTFRVGEHTVEEGLEMLQAGNHLTIQEWRTRLVQFIQASEAERRLIKDTYPFSIKFIDPSKF
jgi:hypothetical protein